jgi:hypothetical protein
LFFVKFDFQLPSPGKEKNVGQANPINRGNEGDRNSLAHLRDVLEMLHDLNQAQHGADNADGWGVSASGFKNLRQPLPEGYRRPEVSKVSIPHLDDAVSA